MIIKSIPAHQVKEGDFLTNIGSADKVEHLGASKLVAITVFKGICKSACYFWYDENELIQVKRQAPVSYTRQNEITHTS